MKYKVGDKVRVKINLVPYEVYGSLTFLGGNMSKCAGQICTIKEVVGDKRYYVSENPFVWSEEMLEPAYADGGKIVYAPNGAPLFWMPEPKKSVSIELPEFVFDAKQAEKLAEEIKKRLANSGIRFKEEKKMPTKFTFYVTEGTRIDKSCNKTVPTMTTEVIYRGNDGCAISGTATCDKTDYNERDGVLNAIANAVVGGNFDREFNKAVKANVLADKKKRTCTYCGQVFETVEEKQAHEAWHVERKKARRERYLLRKRAKEIAFEEAAQKLAKEMQNGDKK